MSGTTRTIAQVDINTALGNPFVIGGPTSIGGAFTFGITLTGNTALTMPTSGTLAVVGGTSGQIQFNNGGVLGGLPVGTSGNSTVIQTTSGGLLLPAILPIATTSALGALIPDGTTISVNPSTGVASAIGGAATSVVVGTTTVGGGSSGQLLFNSGGLIGSLAVTGSGNAVLATSPTLVTPALGTPSAAILTNATGLPVSTGISGLGTGVAASLAIAVTGTGGSVLATSATLTTPTLSGGTGDNIVIGGVTPAAGTFTTLGFTGTFNNNGVPVLSFVNSGASSAIGFNAGALLPANDTETVAIGLNSLTTYAGQTGENTSIGWGSMRTLSGACSSVITTATTTSSAVLTVATAGPTSNGVIPGLFAVGTGIPNGTTVLSSTPTTVTLSASVTVASGVTVSFPSVTLTTTATTTAGTVLTFAATTGAALGFVVLGTGITGVINIVSFTGTTITLSAPVTVASGTILYFGSNSGKFNTAIGVNTMGLSYQDSGNTIVGCDGMRDALGSNNSVLGTTNLRDGIHNRTVAVGANALNSNTISAVTTDNTVVGYQAMSSASLTTASANTVIGSGSGLGLTSGSNNTLVGINSGAGLTTGSSSVFIGGNSGQHVTTASGNIGVGLSALQGAGAGATGGLNVGVGQSTLAAFTSASQNTAVGHSAGTAITTAAQNVMLGVLAGSVLTTGGNNLILGQRVASVTLGTGLSNILIGVDNSCDVAATATSNTVLIKGASPGTAVLSATGTNGTPTTIMGGILGVTPTVGITAHAGGGQASATALTTGFNRVDTVATAADSVKLPATTIAGIMVIVTNNTILAMQGFGTGTDTINGIAAATGISIAAGKTAIFFALATGTWFGGVLT